MPSHTTGLALFRRNGFSFNNHGWENQDDQGQPSSVAFCKCLQDLSYPLSHRSNRYPGNKGTPFGGDPLPSASDLALICVPVYSSEGVQVGGLRSFYGVLGSWTTIFHDIDDPVGEYVQDRQTNPFSKLQGPFWMRKHRLKINE